MLADFLVLKRKSKIFLILLLTHLFNTSNIFLIENFIKKLPA